MKQNKSKKKEPTTSPDIAAELGIEIGKQRERELMAYTIAYTPRATLDRTKYPFVREQRMNEYRFITWSDAYKFCQKLEKKSPEILYSPHTIFIPESEYNKIKHKKK